MLNSKTLLAAIVHVEPSLTSFVMRERPAADRKSVRVASFAALATAVIALLNSIGPPTESLRAVIDSMIDELPTPMLST